MKYLFLVLHLTALLSPLLAEEKEPSDSYTIYLEIGELSAPLSFYTDSWDPKEKLPLSLPCLRVEEKNLVVNLDQAIKKSREEQDERRSQNSWLFKSDPWIPPIESKEEVYEEIDTNESQE